MARKSKWYTQTARILENLDTYARNKGAEGIRASVNEGRSHEVHIREGASEEGNSEDYSRVNVAVYLSNGRHSSFSMDFDSRKFDTDLAQKLIVNRVKSAELHPEDPNAGLADPDQILQETICDESAFDERNLLKPEDMIHRATETEKAALQQADKGIDSSQGAAMDTKIGRSMLYASNGFLGVTSGKSYGIQLIVKGVYEDEQGQKHFTLGADGMNAVEYAELDDPQTLADRVVNDAVRMRHARPLTAADKHDNVALVFESRMAGSFWSGIINALDGQAVANGISFLQDHFNKAVLPENLSIVNDPTLKGTLGHSYFDSNGIPARREVMIDNGVIRNWFLDLYNARKLGMSVTGEPSNILIDANQPNARNLEELVSDIGTGILVTDFNGGGMDTVRGEYKVGAAGLLIRDGEIAEPVRDFSLAHRDLKTMLATTQVAQDRQKQEKIWTPSTRVDGLTLSA